jgi:hypothetical protein
MAWLDDTLKLYLIFKPLGIWAQRQAAGLGHDYILLNPNAAPTRQVDSRFDFQRRYDQLV